MTTYKAYKTQLDPNNEQRNFFGRCAGTARYVYNWALADREAKFEAGEKSNMYEQKRRFNATKDDFCPWVRDVPYVVTESAFMNLDVAYKNFFRKIKQGVPVKDAGKPNFKKRGKRESFTLRGNIRSDGRRIKLPVIGWVRMHESGYIPEETDIRSVTISKRAGRWFISALVLRGDSETPSNAGPVIGVDMGLKWLAVLSTGEYIESPKAYRDAEKKLARLNRERDRRQKGGANRRKTIDKIGRAHYRIANIRDDAASRVVNAVLAHNPRAIVVEDLNIIGMMKNHHLAKSIGDAGMGNVLQKLEEAAARRGIDFVKADRWFPSTKTCSNCGKIKDTMSLSERVYRCDHCGAEMDRDLNAARNLAAYYQNPQPAGDCLGS